VILGDQVRDLKEGMELVLSAYEGEPLDVELPTTVEMEVVEAEMAIAGDTATGVMKKVTVDTGLEVQVPLFVERGDVIRVDTRTGEYVTRV
jgi:elongation factor P